MELTSKQVRNREACKRWRDKNKERESERQRQWIENNREYVNQRQMNYRKNNPDRVQKWKRPKEIGMLIATRSRAKKKGLDFTLELSDIIIPDVCPVFNIPLDYSDREHTPTLDRKDNSKGYTKENTFIISGKANRCKSNLTIEELRQLYLYAST